MGGWDITENQSIMPKKEGEDWERVWRGQLMRWRVMNFYTRRAITPRRPLKDSHYDREVLGLNR